MTKTRFVRSIVWVIFLLIGTSQDLRAGVLEQDSLALVALYESTNGAGWTNNTGWLTGAVSEWHGITVSGERVTRMALGSNNLTGIIPAEIGGLTALEVLHLFVNQLSGSIPPEIGRLSKLKNLNISFNELTGSIPSEIGNLADLEILTFSHNELSGSIPDEIGNLTHLTEIYLQSNQLEGPIPAAIENLINLRNIYFSNNQLSASIPPGIGNLTNLVVLRLDLNQFSDSIPPEIGNLDHLKFLTLHHNQLVGLFPVEIANLENLNHLSLSVNQLSGAIPSELCNLTVMEKLDLSDNQFEDLPDLSADTALVELLIQNNRFTFEDIEPNIGVSTFSYSPQDSVGERRDIAVCQDSSLTLSVSVGGTANQYQWTRDGDDIPGAGSSSYTVDPVDQSSSGAYVCRITNTLATELTLYSRPFNVTVEGAAGVTNHPTEAAKTYALYQNYPNPFNSVTVIKYDLPRACRVVVKIYNLFGQELTTVVDEFQTAGEKMTSWNGLNQEGRAVTSGIYIGRLKTGDFSRSTKMILMR